MEPRALRDHFKWVERDRKAKYSGGGDSQDIRDVPIEGAVSQNEYAKQLKAAYK